MATSILPTVHRPLPSDSSFKSSLRAELRFQSGEKHTYVSQLRRLNTHSGWLCSLSLFSGAQ